MKIQKDVINEVFVNRTIINSLPYSKIESAIYLHFERLTSHYEENKLLYKTIFKSYRFNLVSLIITEFYMVNEPTYTNIYKRFLPLNLMSKNSISTFFSFLLVTGRIRVWPSEKDKRKMAFEVTDKIKNEAFNLINTMVSPLNLVLGKKIAPEEPEDFLLYFFEKFSTIVYNNLFEFKCINHSDIFINKDAGHTIILNLYCNRIKDDSRHYKTLTVKELANNCGVSRSHIKKILSSAGEVGFVINPNSEGNIIITEDFNNFTQEYMKRYFSLCMVGFV